jgi:hypothetical protein
MDTLVSISKLGGSSKLEIARRAIVLGSVLASYFASGGRRTNAFRHIEMAVIDFCGVVANQLRTLVAPEHVRVASARLEAADACHLPSADDRVGGAVNMRIQLVTATYGNFIDS